MAKTFQQFCEIAVVSTIENHIDFLKKLFEIAENAELGFIHDREADLFADEAICKYVQSEYDFEGDVIAGLCNTFYQIYKLYRKYYDHPMLQNLDGSDMADFCLDIVRNNLLNR